MMLLLPLFLLLLPIFPPAPSLGAPPPATDKLERRQPTTGQSPKRTKSSSSAGGRTPPTASTTTDNKMCPLNEHVVCNEMSEHSLRCVCTMFGSGSPPPEQSCTNLLNTSSSLLEATSVKVRLSKSFFPPAAPVAATPMPSGDNTQPPPLNTTSNSADNFLEEKFKSQLAWHFKINQKNILFLRLRCQDDGNVIIQFIVLRRNRRGDQPPFSPKEDLIDADTVVRRINGMKGLQRIGGLEIMRVEKVTELVPVEVDIDNSRLITQAIVVGAFIVITSLCGCWISCRARRPEDEGYEDVVQQPDKV